MNGKQIKAVTPILVSAAIALLAATGATAAPTVYNDEAAFRAAVGSVTAYGFEVHGLAEGVELASPLSAGDLDNSFDLAFTGLNSFQIDNSAGSPGLADGTRCIFSHSVVGANYTLTFSNFYGSGANIAAFGLTVTDFASNITDPASITYSAGNLSGTLLTVDAGQPDYTQNFVGLTVSPAEAFDAITLTFDDNLSGFQYFDEVLYAVPEPATLGLVAVGAAGLVARRRRKRLAATK